MSTDRLPDFRKPVGRGVQHTLAELLPVSAGLLLPGVVPPGSVAVRHSPVEGWQFQVIAPLILSYLANPLHFVLTPVYKYTHRMYVSLALAKL